VKRALLASIAALAAAGVTAGLPAAPAKKAAAARDWTKSIVATPEGGYRIGDPAAPIKLIEYGSLTCGHCAHFAEEGMAPLLQNYVKPGKVSFEFRNFVRDPADMAAALLSRCAATGNFFTVTDRYFSAQKQWIGRIQAAKPATEGLTPQQQIGRFAEAGDLASIAARSGVTPARAKACLADPKALARLVEMRKVAIERHNLTGTPMFLVNGKKAEGATDWASLQPLLGSPGG
jgi:protein-disulfide isomerase